MGPHLRISPWMPIIRRCAPMVATSSNLRILWNVSRFRRVPRGHLRILRIPDGNSKKRPLGWYIFEFSNSLECITSSACVTRPSSNSSNYSNSLRIFEDMAPWLLHLRIFEFFGMYSVFVVCHVAIFEFFEFPYQSEDVPPMVATSSNFRILRNV